MHMKNKLFNNLIPILTTEQGTPTSDPRIPAGALGGGIAAGTLILLIPVLILTVVCVYKMSSHREQRQSKSNEDRQLQSEADKTITLSDLKANESYGTCDIENEDNVVYDEIKINDHEATPNCNITTEGSNVGYGQAMPHITTEDSNVGYGQAVPMEDSNVAYGDEITSPITTEDNVAYNQATPHITTENNVAYSQATPQTEDNLVACGQINEDSFINNPKKISVFCS